MLIKIRGFFGRNRWLKSMNNGDKKWGIFLPKSTLSNQAISKDS
jgi:hypothetical protein